MAKKRPTTKVSNQESKNYFSKANEFFECSITALSTNNWNVAGLLAVQAVISAADSLSGFLAGIRSTSQDHGDTATLLKSIATDTSKEWSAQANRFSRIISKKNLIQYEGRELSEKEAVYLVEQARRFINWVRKNIPWHCRSV